MKRLIALIIAACALGVAGYQVTNADAHTAQIAISCDSVGFNYADFPDAANTAGYSVAVSSGSGSRSGVFSWTGTTFSNSGAIHAVGTSTITASTSWTADGGGQRSSTVTLECQAPPTTTTTPPPPPTVCADGLPPDAGHDGRPGNDACDHTTTVPPSPTTAVSQATTSPTTTTEATTGTTTTQTPTPAPTPTKSKPAKDAGGVLGVTASTVRKQTAVREQLAFTP